VTFQEDLIKQGYHFFDKSKVSLPGYYPNKLKEIITQVKQKTENIFPNVGEVYSVRAFFALSKEIGGECEYQSGFLDVRLIIWEGESFMGEIQTELPKGFTLKKGARIKIRAENIIYKPDYSLLRRN